VKQRALYRLLVALLITGALTQAAAIWLKTNPKAVELTPGKRHGLIIQPLEGSPARGACTLYVICTLECRGCAALAQRADHRPDKLSSLQWLVLGNKSLAAQFQAMHALPASRVAAASLAPALAVRLGFEYLSIPATPLRVVVDGNQVVRLVTTRELTDAEVHASCQGRLP